MIKNFIIIAVCCVSILANCRLNAQQLESKNEDLNVEKTITAIKAAPISFSVYQERNLFSYTTTIVYGLGAYYSFYNNDFPPLIGARFIAVKSKLFGKNYTTNGITPYVSLGIRKQLTLNKRIRLNKNTENKAGSYLALLLEYPLVNKVIENDIDNLQSAVPVSLLFGIRRSLNKFFFIEIEGGFTYKKAQSINEIVPRLNLSLNVRL